MPRKPRIEFPGALYHVVARGNHRQDIFFSNSDRYRYISTLELCKYKYKFSIYAFILMSNHVHLLIETSDIPLSKIMQSLHTSYTQYFNLKHNRSGHLFQGRYKAILCQKDSYLLQIVRYIHQNPLRAGIVTKLEDYQWSSHQTYIGNRIYHFIDDLFVLSLFDSKITKARQRYLQFVYEIDEDLSSRLYQPILGDDAFINEIQRKYKAEAPIEKETSLSMPLSQIAETVAKILNIELKLVTITSKDRRSSLARGIISHIAIDSFNVPLKDVADYLHRDPSSVSRICHKIRLSKDKDTEIQNIIESVLKTIRKT